MRITLEIKGLRNERMKQEKGKYVKKFFRVGCDSCRDVVGNVY